MARGLCLAAGMLLSYPAFAVDDEDPYSMNIERNLATPQVNAKNSEAVASAMSLLTRTLKQAGFKAEGVRNGEVTMVTIQCVQLFAPNSTDLKDGGKKLLLKLLPYIKRSDNYKVVMAVHSDDTGDDIYAEKLTSDRVNAIDEYFANALGGESPIIPYGLGNDEPVAPNVGVANREKNRRLEIYFVPTKNFIDTARKKK